MSIRSYGNTLSGLHFRHVWGAIVDDPDRPTHPPGRRRKSPRAISVVVISPARGAAAGFGGGWGEVPTQIRDMDSQVAAKLASLRGDTLFIFFRDLRTY